jgi:hypothetical protein
MPVNRPNVEATSTGRVRWYPTQAKIRLEWGTQPLLLVQGVGVKAACRDYLEFPMYQQLLVQGVGEVGGVGEVHAAF